MAAFNPRGKKERYLLGGPVHGELISLKGLPIHISDCNTIERERRSRAIFLMINNPGSPDHRFEMSGGVGEDPRDHEQVVPGPVVPGSTGPGQWSSLPRQARVRPKSLPDDRVARWA
jgi:hypothetical protein